MRTSLRLATILASLLSVLLGTQAGLAQGTAQPPATSGAQSSVVVIDIGLIFRKHTRFKQLMEDMKADLEKAERDFQAKRAQIGEMAEGLKTYEVGSPEYNSLEERATEAQVRLQADMAMKKKEFMLQEAQIYYTVYREIEDVVQYVCERHGINLVLRYNSEEIDPKNANSVMKGVNRTVVYQNHVNITFDVLNLLVRQTPPPADPNLRQQPAAPSPRPSVSQGGYGPVRRN